MKKILKLIIALAMVVTLMAATAVAAEASSGSDASADAEETFTFDICCSWPSTNVNYAMMEKYCEMIEKATDGRVTFNILGGSEVFSGAQGAEAVMNGILDCVVTGTNYFSGYVPEVDAINASNMNGDELEASGALDYLRELMSDKKIYPMMIANEVDGICQMCIYTNEPISTLEDLKGQTIRSTGSVVVNILKELGCTAMPLDLGDVFSALEQGLITGYVGPSFLGGSEGYFEYCKCSIRPGISRGGTGVFFNTEVWDSIPEDVRKLIMDSASEINVEWDKLCVERTESNVKLLEEAGGQVIELSEEEAEKLEEICLKCAWDGVREKLGEAADDLYPLCVK